MDFRKKLDGLGKLAQSCMKQTIRRKTKLRIEKLFGRHITYAGTSMVRHYRVSTTALPKFLSML